MFGPCKSDEQSSYRGSDTSILWAAIPSIPVFERCSRKLEGRKQEKHVAIHCSRLMIDTHLWVQNPAYRYTIFFDHKQPEGPEGYNASQTLEDNNNIINNEKTISFCSTL